MGLFKRSKSADNKGEQPFYQTSRMSFYVKVYSNRIEFKHGMVHQSIPIKQIANVELGVIGQDKIIIETTGGEKFDMVAPKKKQLREAIYKAIDASTIIGQPHASDADELTKLAQLRQKGIVTQQEFDAKKRQILGL